MVCAVVGLGTHSWKQHASVSRLRFPVWQQLPPQQTSCDEQVMQVPSRQVMVPNGQPQLPPRQVLSPVQVTSHAPQFALSVPRRTKLLPHRDSAAGQTQALLEQVAAGGQALPQLPQWLAFDFVLTQFPPQFVWFEGQVMTQAPFWHVVPLPHSLLHWPQ